MEHPPRKLGKRVIHFLSKWLALQQWKSEGLNLLSAGGGEGEGEGGETGGVAESNRKMQIFIYHWFGIFCNKEQETGVWEKAG